VVFERKCKCSPTMPLGLRCKFEGLRFGRNSEKTDVETKVKCPDAMPLGLGLSV